MMKNTQEIIINWKKKFHKDNILSNLDKVQATINKNVQALKESY